MFVSPSFHNTIYWSPSSPVYVFVIFVNYQMVVVVCTNIQISYFVPLDYMPIFWANFFITIAL